MLTNKGKYGLKAMLHLATLPVGGTALGAEIASANQIPKKFLDAILLEMRNAGMLRTRKALAAVTACHALRRRYETATSSARWMARLHRSTARARAPTPLVRTARTLRPVQSR